MMTISTDQEKVFKELIDLLAELVAKRLDKKSEETEVNSKLIDEIVSEVISHSDFEGAVQDQAYDAVKGMSFRVLVD